MSRIFIRPMREDDLKMVSELAMLANPHAEKEKYREHILDELRSTLTYLLLLLMVERLLDMYKETFEVQWRLLRT